VFNLEWCTPKENSEHAHATGLIPPYKQGFEHHSSKYPKDSIIKALELLSEGKSNAIIKEQTGLPDGEIYALVRGDIHKETVAEFKIMRRRKDLSKEDIHSICKDIVSKKMGIYKIAEKWDLSADYVYALINNEYHPEITSQYPLADSIKRRLTDDEVRDIWRDIMSKELSISKLAKKYGMSEPYIKKLKAGKLRPDIRAEFIKD
jgi:hypothetical protein